MSINARIKQIRKCNFNYNQTTFANMLGIAQNTISTIEKEGATVTDQNIKTICSVFSVNEEWLRHGTGEMFSHLTTQQELSKLVAKIMSDSDNALKTEILLTAAKIIDNDTCYSIIIEQLNTLKNSIKNPE